MQFEAPDYKPEGIETFKRNMIEKFVKKEYHHQGIVTALFHYLLKDVLNENTSLKEITLNSSPYGKGFYLHIGFVPLSEEKETDGIRFTPMKYLID